MRNGLNNITEEKWKKTASQNDQTSLIIIRRRKIKLLLLINKQDTRASCHLALSPFLFYKLK